MSKKATKSSKTPVDIHAIPDGEFHFTDEQKQLLAEFEATNPLAVDDSVNEMPKIEFFLQNLTPTQQALVDFVHDVTAGKSIDKDRWLEAVVDYIRTYDTSMVFWYVFNQLEIHLPQNHYTLFGIIELYVLMLSCFDNYSIARDLPYPNNYHMYHFIRRHLTDKATLIEQLKPLQATRFHYLKHSRVQDFFVYVFPDDMIATANLKDLKLTENGDEMWRFFYAIPVFAKSYAQRVRNYTPRGFDQNAYEKGMNETYLLYTIAHQQTAVIQLIDAYFQRTAEMNQSGDWRKSDYPKIRNNLNFLEAYHHLDVLDFLTIYANDTIVEKYLKNWLKRYPLVTLNHFLAKIPERHPWCATVLKNLITTTLMNNPTFIAPLQAMLDDTQQALLAEIIALIPKDVLENMDNEPVKPQAKSTAKKDDTPKALKFPELPLQRFNKPIITSLPQLKSDEFPHHPKEELLAVAEILNEPEKYLFTYFSDDDTQELEILKQYYANFDTDQKCLAHFYVLPSVLISERYQRIKSGQEAFRASDYQNFRYPQDIRTDSPVSRPFGIYHWSVRQIILQKMSVIIRQALFQADFILGLHGAFKKSGVDLNLLQSDLLIYLRCNGEQAIETVMSHYSPLYENAEEFYKIKLLQYIGYYQFVPFFLNAFNTKTKKDMMERYFKDFPQTVLDETVYLLFTKQTDETLKKAKKKCQAIF